MKKKPIEEFKHDNYRFSTEHSRCNSMSEDFDSKFYPRTPPLFSKLNSSETRKHEDMFTSASPIKLKFFNEGDDIIKGNKTSKHANHFNDKKFSHLSEILKNFSLNDFTNDFAETKLDFSKSNNEIKIINVKDLNETNNSHTSSLAETDFNTEFKNDFKRESVKKSKWEIFKKKKYVIISIVVLVIILYLLTI